MVDAKKPWRVPLLHDAPVPAAGREKCGLTANLFTVRRIHRGFFYEAGASANTSDTASARQMFR
jgi:hypothetical protein